MIKEKDVPTILKDDGVAELCKFWVDDDVIKVSCVTFMMGGEKSWAATLVDTESNSATLIGQMPGEGNREHYHEDWDEWWFIMNGKWKWEYEGNSREVEPGELVKIKRGVKHKITAVGDEMAVRLAVSRYDVNHIYEDK